MAKKAVGRKKLAAKHARAAAVRFCDAMCAISACLYC